MQGPPQGSHLQVLLDVLAVVGDTTGRDARLPHQLKADLATKVVGDVSLLQHKGGSERVKGLALGTPQPCHSSPFSFHPPARIVHPCPPGTCPVRNEEATWARASQPDTHTDTPPHTHTHSLCSHMFGLNAGLLGLDVTVILIPLKAALALFQLPAGGWGPLSARPAEAYSGLPPPINVSLQ